MLRTVMITGIIACTILAAIFVLAMVAGATFEAAYLEFALALVMFLVIIVGSYWSVFRRPRRHR